MIYKKQNGVPEFEAEEYNCKTSKYVILIPVINEGEKIRKELERAKQYNISSFADIVICDGNSTDGSLEDSLLKTLDVNTLLIKKSDDRQGAQIRMGFWWALERGYEGIITIDGNNKDSIENVPDFIKHLEDGYDFIQGSRFLKRGNAINTPVVRYFAIRFIHSPIISLTAKKWYTDTTNGFRAYSAKYLKDERVQPLRDIFNSYELYAYLSVRANQIGLKTCEIPVSRFYKKNVKGQSKISSFNGYFELFIILLKNLFKKYNIK